MINHSKVFGQPPTERPFDLLRPYPTDWILSRVVTVNMFNYWEHTILLQNMSVLKEAVSKVINGLDGIVPQFMQLLDRPKEKVFKRLVMSLIIKEGYICVAWNISRNRLGDLLMRTKNYKQITGYATKR